MQATLLIIAAALLLAWLFLRRRIAARGDEPAQKAARSEKTAYHAVSIKLGDKACDAARELSGKRFLSNEAPQLPLPGCDVAECDCRFTHHHDRRSGRDRRSPFAAAAGFGGGTGSFERERRQRSDRREDADADLS